MSSTEQIKILRQKTGAGFMDCKAALQESQGDIEQAKISLRKKGLLDADKKSSRDASQGIVSIFRQGNKITLLELKCETDFVARNNDFLQLALELTQAASSKKIIKAEDLLLDDKLKEKLALAVAKIGENIKIGKIKQIEGVNLNYYIHDKKNESSGSIISCVSLTAGDDLNIKNSELDKLGKMIAMQIAANKPKWLAPKDIDQKTIETEKSIYTEQFLKTGKDAAIIEKMMIGKLNKFYQQNCLIKQQSIHDSSKTIEKLCQELSKQVSIIDYRLIYIGDKD